MIISAEKIAAVPTDSAAYHTGVSDIRDRGAVLQENLADAIPYMYVSFSNIIFASVWIAAILAIFAILNKKKQQLKEYDVSNDVYEIFSSLLISSTALIPKISLTC